jgi:hypothetical protein
VRNNSATGISRIYNIAGTIDNRAESQHLMTTDEHIISTSSAHPIRLQANRLTSAVSALTIDIANQFVFGAPVGILTDAPSTELDVNGGIACASLNASGAATCANLTVADRIDAEHLQVTSATGFTPIVLSDTSLSGAANLTFKVAEAVGSLFINSAGCRLQTTTEHPIRMSANRDNSPIVAFQINTDNGVAFGSSVSTAGALTVQGRNVLNDIDSKQAAVTANSLAISDVALLSDSLAAKEDNLTSSSLVTVGSLTSGALDVSGAATLSNLTVADRIDAEDLRVTSATGFTPIIISDTSGSGTAMLRLISAGVTFQIFANTTTAFIQTSQANRILMRA